MTSVEFVEQLNQQLQDIEASAREYDAGKKDAVVRIAASLRAIVHQTGASISLLAHLQARHTRLLASVGKPPYPQDLYSPMAEVEGMFDFPAIHVAAQPATTVEPTRYRPMLERKKLTRQVQAPDWWANEPAIIQHGKKTTRRVIARWAADAGAPEITRAFFRTLCPQFQQRMGHSAGRAI